MPGMTASRYETSTLRALVYCSDHSAMKQVTIYICKCRINNLIHCRQHCLVNRVKHPGDNARDPIKQMKTDESVHPKNNFFKIFRSAVSWQGLEHFLISVLFCHVRGADLA